MPKPNWGSGRDWRGTEIRPGDTVIYATGERCKPVQAEVVSLIPGGLRAKLKPIYRADYYEWGTPAKTVQVDVDKLTVVVDLPACQLPETMDELRVRLQQETKIRDSHDMRDIQIPASAQSLGALVSQTRYACVNCGLEFPETRQQLCFTGSLV